ncbi:MAG TPA: hypothetical protein V6C72_10045, partial [Chroococcales cyanobacterium]
AALIPVFHIAPALLNTSEQFAGWPLQFEHQPLHEVPLAPDSAAFADRFPGRIKVFTTGSRRVVMRWVCKPTRQLHPSSSCYSAGGFAIKWLPEFTDQSGQRWNQFEANRAAERLLVRERIYDNHGHSWTDISAWYWSAVLKETNSPWWNVTVAERLR